jgi:hypothetical protein
MCKCVSAHYIFDAEICSFCYSCSCIIPHTNVNHITRCPGCNKQESREHIGFPCLAGQCANVVFRNLFIKRYDTLLNTWLPTSSDIDYSSESNGDNNGLQTPRQQQIYSYTINKDKQIDLLRIRQQSFEESLNTIRSNSSKEQNQELFKNLLKLQKSVQKYLETDDEEPDRDEETKDSSIKMNSDVCSQQIMTQFLATNMPKQNFYLALGRIFLPKTTTKTLMMTKVMKSQCRTSIKNSKEIHHINRIHF